MEYNPSSVREVKGCLPLLLVFLQESPWILKFWPWTSCPSSVFTSIKWGCRDVKEIGNVCSVVHSRPWTGNSPVLFENQAVERRLLWSWIRKEKSPPRLGKTPLGVTGIRLFRFLYQGWKFTLDSSFRRRDPFFFFFKLPFFANEAAAMSGTKGG